MKKQFILFPCLVILSLASCVPARKFEETQAKYTRCEEELGHLKSQTKDLETSNTEMTSQLQEIRKKINLLENDTTLTGKSLRHMTTNYDKLYETYEILLQKNREIAATNVAETKKLSGQLQLTQEELQKKEDALKILERDLEAKKQNLDALNAELKKREEKVAELQDILKKKDQAVVDLKKKVSDALTGFVNNGLTVETKNGKVYVSLDESLLFASGSTKVDPKGIEALKKLAKVLEQNAEINILVEGHTDNVPLAGTGLIKDNWDLSVMRATSIVKIIMENSKMDARRLTAAGRGEYFPIDPADTKEARKKNRRTEIILTPKLDELLQMLETN